MADTPAPGLPGKRDLFNKVMVLLGSAKRIDDPDNPDDPEAANLSALWDLSRRAAIALHPWNAAIDRQKLEREAGDASELGYAWRFKLPIGWVRWLPWDRDNALWFDAVEEGGYLLSDNDGPIVARGLRDLPEITRWPPLLAETVVYTLAIEYCQVKTQLVGLRDRLVSDRAERLDEAYRVDGLASGNRKRGPSVVNSRWAGARFRSTGVIY